MGAIVFSFQQLEYQLMEILVALLDKPTLETLVLLKTKFDFGRLLTGVVKVAEKQIRSEDMVKELKTIVEKASKFADQRNLLVHSHYHVINSSPEKLTIERSGTRLRSGTDTRETLNPEVLFQLAEEMGKTVHEAEIFYQDLMQYLHYDPEEEAWRDEMIPPMTLADVRELFSNIGDLSDVDTDGIFLLGKKS